MVQLSCQITSQDASMLELFYELLRERQRPEDVEPLQVVVDKRGLHIVRGHRRGLVLGMLQGAWRHRTVKAPCLLYDAKDPVVARQFSDMDTAVDGLGLHLHGRHSEAYHRGKPLFRTSQEWCDSVADVPVQESCQNPEARPTRFNKSDRPNCQRSAHLSTQAAANPLDPGSLEQDLAKCQRERDPPAIAAPALLENQTRKGPSAGPGELKEGTVVCVTKRNGSRVSGEVVEISQHDQHDSVRVRYHDTDQAGQMKTDWFPLQRLQVPDFSKIKLGMQATAVETETGKHFDCQVLEVSVDKRPAHAPVRVHYTGFSTDDDEWIGADRLRSKLLMFHDAMLPAKTLKGAHSDIEECQRASTAKARGSNGFDDESGTESQDLDCAERKFVCCLWLEGKCWHKGQHFLGKRLYLHEDIPGLPCGFGTSCNYKHYETRKGPSAGPGELKEGTVVCVTKRNGSRVSGEVVEISQHDQHDSVRVRYHDTDQAGQMKTDWFPLQRLQVPDFSKIKLGMQATAVETETGKHFDCQVLEVSVDKRPAHAPVRVHYTGFSTDDDEWIGADRLRSKLLMFHDAMLPAKTLKGAHSDIEECQRASTAKARGSNGFDDESGTESQDLDCAGRKFVCCMWLEGKCWHKGQHFLGKRLYLHEDIPGLPCGFGTSCNYKHYETRKGPSAGPGELKEGTVVCVTKRNGSRVSGEVVEISQHDQHDSVRVRYHDTDQAGQMKTDWFPLQRLQVPDFSKIKLGMQATAVETETGKHFDCQVLEVSVDKRPAHAPVRVHYTGFSTDDDEWIGADRLRSKLLMFHDAMLPAKTLKGAHSDIEECQRASTAKARGSNGFDDEPGTESQDLDCAGRKFVCCLWLEGKCWHKGQHFLGKRLYVHEDIPGLPCGFGTSCNYKHYETRKGPSAGPGELKEGTVVCVTKRNGSRVSGEVVEISQHDQHVGQEALGRQGQASSAHSSRDEAQDVVSAAAIADLPDALPTNALPWHEPDSEAHAFDHALRAAEEALGRQAQAEEWQSKLERTLADVETEGLRGVLEKHGWSGWGSTKLVFLLSTVLDSRE